ncbi:MAG: trypsin-like peptidase domain-containing protein [Candidatus Bathyarchaeota archaeon]|nr:trypsin-like peptidase domain-containing protein [Candidatus Bathyarchaeota archaeon]
MEALAEHRREASTMLLALILIAGIVCGGIIVGFLAYREIIKLEDKISNLQAQISTLWGFQNVSYQNITVYFNETALTEIYNRVRDSVVLVHGTTSTGTVQGSGFVYNYSGTMLVITNNHVVSGTTSRSVTFSNGNGYAAEINGTDRYADLAILTVDAPESEFKPLEIVRSSTLRVGEPVIAIGNPYGLVGSMTTGVVSALGRTITESNYTGRYAIANIIQTSAPINPGNSGGPLLNYDGKVVGITTAIIAESQGVGFAVPSNTILKEIKYLVENGFYDQHSYLGVGGIDMSYSEAQLLGVNVTYGWLVVEVVYGGPAFEANIHVNDIIVGFNGTRIKNGDELSSYMEEKTLPGQILVLNIVRGTETLDLPVGLEKRP